MNIFYSNYISYAKLWQMFWLTVV